MRRVRSHLSRLVRHPLAHAAVVLVLAAISPLLSDGSVQILCFVLVGIIFAQSINILTGIAGQISLGHAGFFGIGAYGAGILAKSYGLEFYLTIPIASALSAAAAYLLSFPAGRVREVYLAMMTLGFGMIFFEVVREWNDLTGGTMGLPGVPSASLRTLTALGRPVGVATYFVILLLATTLFLIIMNNITRSRIGRACSRSTTARLRPVASASPQRRKAARLHPQRRCSGSGGRVLRAPRRLSGSR